MVRCSGCFAVVYSEGLFGEGALIIFPVGVLQRIPNCVCFPVRVLHWVSIENDVRVFQ